MEKEKRIKTIYLNLKESGKIKDFLVFLVFLCVAAFFWFLVSVDYQSPSGLKDTVIDILGAEEEKTDSAAREVVVMETDTLR